MTDRQVREPVRLHTGSFCLSNTAVNSLEVSSNINLCPLDILSNGSIYLVFTSAAELK
jgi:hypothetical protein